MAVLSDRDIKRYLQEGIIRINPFPDFEEALGPCSVDLRLGRTFRVFEHSRCPYIDIQQAPDIEDFMREVVVAEGEPFIMQPREFVLATTIEWIELPDHILGRLEGRSSLGRLGIIVHGTAPRFDPGWRGNAVMELGNIGQLPVALYPGMRICSMTFEELTSPAEVPYYKRKRAKYKNQAGPLGSRLGKD